MSKDTQPVAFHFTLGSGDMDNFAKDLKDGKAVEKWQAPKDADKQAKREVNSNH